MVSKSMKFKHNFTFIRSAETLISKLYDVKKLKYIKHK